jgi:hypothetical protein
VTIVSAGEPPHISATWSRQTTTRSASGDRSSSRYLADLRVSRIIIETLACLAHTPLAALEIVICATNVSAHNSVLRLKVIAEGGVCVQLS